MSSPKRRIETDVGLYNRQPALHQDNRLILAFFGVTGHEVSRFVCTCSIQCTPLTGF